jgi:hypothetical protein
MSWSFFKLKCNAIRVFVWSIANSQQTLSISNDKKTEKKLYYKVHHIEGPSVRLNKKIRKRTAILYVLFSMVFTYCVPRTSHFEDPYLSFGVQSSCMEYTLICYRKNVLSIMKNDGNLRSKL